MIATPATREVTLSYALMSLWHTAHCVPCGATATSNISNCLNKGYSGVSQSKLRLHNSCT